jgi:hypothetical protein
MEDLLKRTRLLHVAVSTARGPHVTPQAFTWWAGRFWIVTFRDAFKERVMRRRPRVSLLLGDDERFFNVDAEAKVLDPLSPIGLFDALPEVMLAPSAAASWSIRNARNVVGYIRDALDGDLPALISPQQRILVALRPLGVTEVARPEPKPEETAVPARVGIDTPLGPLVVPGLWEAAEQRASIAPLELPSDVRVAIEVDGPFHDRPSRNRGSLLRGTAVTSRSEDRVVLNVSPEVKTRWSGARTATHSVA